MGLQRVDSSQHASSSSSNGTIRDGDAVQWFDIGSGRLLARHPRLLCEYDAQLRAPVGAVFIDMGASPHTCAFGEERPQKWSCIAVIVSVGIRWRLGAMSLEVALELGSRIVSSAFQAALVSQKSPGPCAECIHP